MSVFVRTFGKYLLDEEIARGGMSRVYLARLRGLGGFEKRLVVKQVLPELAKDPRFVAMFVHEAKTVVQMSHPHIAPVYELGVVDGVYFLAMEYIEGATLAEIVRDGPVAPELAAHLGVEVCDALHYACSRFDLVHRDVTPRNVIVDRAGHSRLLDFGIAAPVEAEGGSELFGTPGYLSPEHLEGRPLTASSDVFSLGAVLFEIVTGRRAFPAANIEEARAALEGEGPTFADLPKGLEVILGRALERDPGRRYASAQKLARALRGWLAGHSPEGVGPELGHRAERALAHRTSGRLDSGAISLPLSTPSEVRTLATSRLLDALLEEGGVPSVDARSDDDATSAPGTARIEGRASRPAPEAPGTARIEGRPSRPEVAEASAAPEPSSVADAPIAGDAEASAAESNPASSSTATSNMAGSSTAGSTTAGSSTGSHAARRSARRKRKRASPDALEPRSLARPVTPEPVAPVVAALDRRWLATLAVAALAVVALAVAGPLLWPREDPFVARPTAFEPTPLALDGPPVLDVAAPPAVHEPASTQRVEEPAPPDPPAPLPPPVAARGFVTVSAVPWGEVVLDGRAVGNTPQRRLPLRPGPHRIEVRCPPLGRSVDASFDVEAGRTATVIADLSRDPARIQVR